MSGAPSFGSRCWLTCTPSLDLYPVSSSKDLELENLYSSLLHESSPHEKAIQKDLTRTFPSHKFFQRPQSADGEDMDERGRGQDELFNVVKAYSLYDPDVGYVQGSAFIVASLLLNVRLCSVPSPRLLCH